MSTRDSAAFAALTFLFFLFVPCVTAQVCEPPLDGERTVLCALSTSPELQIAQRELGALRGRRVTAGIWLPSNPNISFNADQRQPWENRSGESVFNWYATLSQEVEVAGQRSLRLSVVDAQTQAQIRRIAVTELEVAAQALTAFLELQAAREQIAVADHLGQIAASLSSLADARAKGGLLSEVDADVAKSESTRIAVARYQAQRQYFAALGNLNVLLGRDPDTSIELTGELGAGPLPPDLQDGLSQFVSRALLLRGEVAAAAAERSALVRQLTLLRRERIPNPTLSIFAQRDGFNERVLGGGISIPIPLRAPVGQTRAGEIQETIARIDQAGANVELVRRRVRVEAARAYSDWQTSSEATKLFAPDLVARSYNDLDVIREAIGSRQLSLREALLAQRSLIDLLVASIEIRRNHALAWVNLMRVGGFALPGMNR